MRSGIDDILGKESLEAFLYYSHLNLDNASPKNIHEALVKIFREDGAEILEATICQRLCKVIGISYKNDKPFHTVVEQIKQTFERNSIQRKGKALAHAR